MLRICIRGPAQPALLRAIQPLIADGLIGSDEANPVAVSRRGRPAGRLDSRRRVALGRGAVVI
jgi:hypothetical protein